MSCTFTRPQPASSRRLDCYKITITTTAGILNRCMAAGYFLSLSPPTPISFRCLRRCASQYRFPEPLGLQVWSTLRRHLASPDYFGGEWRAHVRRDTRVVLKKGGEQVFHLRLLGARDSTAKAATQVAPGYAALGKLLLEDVNVVLRDIRMCDELGRI